MGVLGALHTWLDANPPPAMYGLSSDEAAEAFRGSFMLLRANMHSQHPAFAIAAYGELQDAHGRLNHALALANRWQDVFDSQVGKATKEGDRREMPRSVDSNADHRYQGPGEERCVPMSKAEIARRYLDDPDARARTINSILVERGLRREAKGKNLWTIRLDGLDDSTRKRLED